jgi:HEAT repeat protein
MRWVRGFDGEILEALKSGDSKIRCEAVSAAGNGELDAAWPHVVELVEDPFTPKKLLLAAIGAVASIRPAEAGEILIGLMASEDQEIVEAADEAILEARSFAEGGSVDEEEEHESEWIN